MDGFPKIGAMYLLREINANKVLVWSVIENNMNDNTSTLMVIEQCLEKGRKIKVDAKWLYEKAPIGPTLIPSGDIVIEDGKEFIRVSETKVQSKVLKAKGRKV